MLYCARCRSLVQDTAHRCQNCRSSRLRAVENSDLVLLHRADEYAAKRLTDLFDTAGVIYDVQPFARSMSTHLYDSEVLPTDKVIYVRYADLETAQNISAALKDELDRQNDQPDPEDGEEVSPKKRIALEIVSVLTFLILVMLAVFGADAFAGWLRGLMGL